MAEIKDVLEMRIAGYVLTTTMEDVSTNNPIPAFWESVFSSDKAGKLEALKGRCKGCYGVSYMLNDNDMEYMVGVALEDDTQPLGEGHVFAIPAGKYVVFDTTLENLPATYEKSFSWLEENNYTIAHGMSFEFYGEDFEQTKVLSIYIPIN